MKTFTIDSDNNITIFASEKQAKATDATGTEAFTSQEELTKLAAEWPGGRLVEIWNSLTGGGRGQEVYRPQDRHRPDLEGHPEPAARKRGGRRNYRPCARRWQRARR